MAYREQKPGRWAKGWLTTALLLAVAGLLTGCDEDPQDTSSASDGTRQVEEQPAPQTDASETGASGDGAQEVSRSRTLSSTDPIVVAAEQKYTAAYNKYTSLIHAGKGDTVEGQQARTAYLKARQEYNAVLAKVKPPKQH